jgi:hypothetical protein
MKNIFSLKRKEVIDAIKDCKEVYFKHGVWNPYTVVSVEKVIMEVQRSGYGADLREEDGKYFVSVPSDGDMF